MINDNWHSSSELETIRERCGLYQTEDHMAFLFKNHHIDLASCCHVGNEAQYCQIFQFFQQKPEVWFFLCEISQF